MRALKVWLAIFRILIAVIMIRRTTRSIVSEPAIHQELNRSALVRRHDSEIGKAHDWSSYEDHVVFTCSRKEWPIGQEG